MSFSNAVVELSPIYKDLELKFIGLFKMITDCLIDIPRIAYTLNKKEIEKTLNKENTNYQEQNEKITRIDNNDEYRRTSLQNILLKSKYYQKCTEDVFDKIAKDYKQSYENIKEKFKDFTDLQKIKEDFKIDEYLEKKPKVDQIKKKIEDFDIWAIRVENDIPSTNIKGIFSVDIGTVKSDFTVFLNNSKKTLMDYLKEMYKRVMDKIIADGIEGNSLLTKKKSTIQAICDYIERLMKYKPNLERLERRCKKIDMINQTIKQFKIELTPKEQGDFASLEDTHTALEKKFNEALDEINKNRDNNINSVLIDVNDNKNEIAQITDVLTNPSNSIFLDVKESRENILNGLSIIEGQIKECQKKAIKYETNLRVSSSYYIIFRL